MNTDPSQLREDIEQTRTRLSENVDALADQANPARMAKRQVSRVKAAAGRFVERIMGTAEELGDAAVEGVRGTAGDLTTRAREVADSVAELPRSVRQQTQGNPIAAGVVAFGVGLLLAAAFPPSRKEKELARAVQEQVQPLTDQLMAAGQEIAENLAGPAREAVGSLTESVGEAVQHVQEEGASAVSEVQDAVKGSADDVIETARQSMEPGQSQDRPAERGA